MHTDFTKGDLKDHIIKLAVPAIIGYFFHTLFNITDTFFAGTISTQALAAMSLSSSVFFMILAVGIGMGEAVTSLVGNAFGEKNIPKAHKIVANAIMFSLVLSVFLSIVGLLGLPYLLQTLGDPSYTEETYAYVNTVLYSTIFFIFVFFINAFLNAVGDMKSLRNALIFTTFLNIILNYIFVMHFGYGVQSIAIATVICEIITLCYLFYKFKQTKLYVSYKDFELDFSIIKELFVQGLPPSVNLFMMAFGMYVIMYFISPFGKEAIAAFGIGMRIEQIFLMPIIGLNIAILSILSQNNGAKLYDRIEPTVILALKMGWIFSFVGVASFFLMSDFLASLLTSDVRVIEQTTLYLRICGLSSFAFVVIFMYIAMLQSIKKPNIIMPVSIYRQILAPAFFFSILFYFKVEIFYYWITLDFIIFSSSIYIWWYSKEKLNELRVMI